MFPLCALTAFLISFLATFLSTPKIASYMAKIGVTGIDVHKPSKPRIPEMVGLSMLIGLTLSLGILILADSSSAKAYLAVMLSTITAALVGLLDDLKDLSPLHKILLATLTGLPILILEAYNPRPVIPFIGRVRLTIVYPLAIPLALSVTSNAMNMSDPVNGAMSGSSSIILATMVAAYLLSSNHTGVLTGLALLGAVLAFYVYNRYPARVFSGNVGSFAVGASLGALVAVNGLELVAVVAMLPQILNSYLILSTMGGLKGRRSIVIRPVKLLNNGLMKAVDDRRAPITLVRMLLADSAKTERTVAWSFLALTGFSSAFALITALLILYGV